MNREGWVIYEDCAPHTTPPTSHTITAVMAQLVLQ